MELEIKQFFCLLEQTENIDPIIPIAPEIKETTEFFQDQTRHIASTIMVSSEVKFKSFK